MHKTRTDKRPKAHRARLGTLYPFLFAVHPVLYLFSINRDEAPAGQVIRPALVALAGTGLIYLLLRALLKSSAKAAAVTALAVLYFWLCRPICEIAYGSKVFGLTFGRTSILAPAMGVCAVAGAVLLVRSRSSLERMTRFLNAFGIVLMAFTLINIVSYNISSRAGMASLDRWRAGVASEFAGGRINLPASNIPRRNVYYIILDMYARDDALKRDYGFDNKAFTDYLRSKGFYVARQGRSNYLYTHISLGSLLNMDYVQPVLKSAGLRPTERTFLAMNRTNKLFRLMKAAGYTVVYLPPEGYVFLEAPNADLVKASSGLGLSDFERALVLDSLLHPVAAAAYDHRQHVLDEFAELETIPAAPTFTFAHILCPHPPYVFDAQGGRVANPGSPETRSRLYTNQLAYVNKRVEGMIDRILSESKTPPVIVIQGDHGTWLGPGNLRSSGVLLACYFPDGGGRRLYPTITSVNAVRTMLDYYLGMSYPRLPDVSYQQKLDGGEYSFREVEAVQK